MRMFVWVQSRCKSACSVITIWRSSILCWWSERAAIGLPATHRYSCTLFSRETSSSDRTKAWMSSLTRLTPFSPLWYAAWPVVVHKLPCIWLVDRNGGTKTELFYDLIINVSCYKQRRGWMIYGCFCHIPIKYQENYHIIAWHIFDDFTLILQDVWLSKEIWYVHKVSCQH